MVSSLAHCDQHLSEDLRETLCRSLNPSPQPCLLHYSDTQTPDIVACLNTQLHLLNSGKLPGSLWFPLFCTYCSLETLRTCDCNNHEAHHIFALSESTSLTRSLKRVSVTLSRIEVKISLSLCFKNISNLDEHI